MIINLMTKLLTTLRKLSIIIIISISANSQAISFDKKVMLENRIESFFEDLNTMEGEFIQVSPSGIISNGKIFIDLPGKIRLDYINPDNLLITCKGFWLVIQDRNLQSSNNIPIQQTPFGILLNKEINFNNKKIILDLKRDLGVITLKLQLAENIQAGQLIIEFSENPFILKKWIIKDMIGDETTVLIQKTKFGHKLPHTLFFPVDFPEPQN